MTVDEQIRRLSGVAWLAMGSVLALVSILYTTHQTVGLLAHEEHDEVWVVPGEGLAVLDLDSTEGAVEVVGTDRSSVRISARISDGLTPTRYTQEVVGDRLVLRVRCRTFGGSPWCRAHLRIEVPRQLAVQVHTGDGGIDLRNLAGPVVARSGDADVSAEALSGTATLRSTNGSVTATRMRSTAIDASTENEDVRVELEVPPTALRAHSTNGDVEVALPQGDEAYRLLADTTNGDTRTQVRTDPNGTRRIEATSENGDVVVRYLD